MKIIFENNHSADIEGGLTVDALHALKIMETPRSTEWKNTKTKDEHFKSFRIFRSPNSLLLAQQLWLQFDSKQRTA